MLFRRVAVVTAGANWAPLLSSNTAAVALQPSLPKVRFSFPAATATATVHHQRRFGRGYYDLTKPLLTEEELDEQQRQRKEKADSSQWDEPELTDVDRSIPQVDLRFISELVRLRRKVRADYLASRSAAREQFEAVKEAAIKKAALQEAEERHQMEHREQKENAAAPSKLSRVVQRIMRRSSGSPGEEEGVHLNKKKSQKKVKMVDTKNTSMLPFATSEVVKEAAPPNEYRPEYGDGFTLIDVRALSEVTSWGMIEGAKLLPMHEFYEALHMRAEEFEEQFGFKKPGFQDRIIFYCQFGPRSLMAAQIASWMGYENVLHFKEGYHQWSKQFNMLTREMMEHDKRTGNDARRLEAIQFSKELGRAIAPEFNVLIEKEAESLRIDHTRSRGTLKVGGTTGEDAFRLLESTRAMLTGGGGEGGGGAQGEIGGSEETPQLPTGSSETPKESSEAQQEQ